MKSVTQGIPSLSDPMLPAMNALEQALVKAANLPMVKRVIEAQPQDNEAQALTPEELDRVNKYIEHASKILPRCPVADFCDDELQTLLVRYVAEKEREMR